MRFARVLPLLLTPACVPNLGLPSDASIECESDGDCPSEQICSAALQRCVLPGGDTEPPTVVAGSLAVAPARLGPPQGELVRLDWVEARVTANRIEGTVQSIDSFGNLITDIPAEALARAPRGEEVAIVCDDHETRGIFNTYADQPEMTLIALVGSSGKLELAIVGDSAAAMLGIHVGTPVTITW